MRDANLETWSKLMIDLVNSEAYGVDASADMLAQAHAALKDQPRQSVRDDLDHCSAPTVRKTLL